MSLAERRSGRDDGEKAAATAAIASESSESRDAAAMRTVSGSGAPSKASPSTTPGPLPRMPTTASSLNSPPDQASHAKQARLREAEEDRELIAKAQQGDRIAFRQLVERHQRRAFSLALSLVRDESDARELVQEAFLRVHKGLGSFQGTSSFFTWLYRIITNLSIDLLRKPGRQIAELDEERTEQDDTLDSPLLAKLEGSDPAGIVRRREIALRVQTALDALPSYHRGVIVLREIDGLSYEEMAQSMGVSKGTIMSRLFHARQKLQKALADCYLEQVGQHPPKEGGKATADERDARTSDLPQDAEHEDVDHEDHETNDSSEEEIP